MTTAHAFDPITAPVSKAALQRAIAALDELVLLTLVTGPMKKRQLRLAVSPFGALALDAALARLTAAQEIAGEGHTSARIYRLVQRTSAPSAAATPRRDGSGRTYGGRIQADGIEFDSIWPLASDPKAPPTALNRMGAR